MRKIVAKPLTIISQLAGFWTDVLLIDKLGFYMMLAAGYNLYQRSIGVANTVITVWGVPESIYVTLVVMMLISGGVIMISHHRLSPKHKAIFTAPLCVYVFLAIVASFDGYVPSVTAALYVGLLDIVLSSLGKPQSYDATATNTG